ncbi:MAG: antirestriction protein ArdA, partial [Pirellulales bacterium]|nr:antirestriction protein ArdA [Pirellulales bacterium]
MTESLQPRIYVACLAAYNSGHLHGAWIDAVQSTAEIHEEVQSMLASSRSPGHRNRAPDTYEWYRYLLERFANCYPDLVATELRPHHIEAWANGLAVSVTTRRNHLRSVKRCLRWAKKQGYIVSNPIAELELPAAQHREVLITPQQYHHFCTYIRNCEFYDLVATTWETGCRPQESLRVEARHVDLTNHRWVFPRSESKSKRISRVVYLTDNALKITKRLMHRYPAGCLFRNSKRRPWTTDAVNCAFRSIRMRMGKDEIKRSGEAISPEEIAGLVPSLNEVKRSGGQELP